MEEYCEKCGFEIGSDCYCEKGNETEIELLKECLHVLNGIPRTAYYYNDKDTNTYKLAAILTTHIKLADDCKS